jgi:hypothetical protein
MPYAEDWKTAKTAFETATNKKKPSDKVLGIFRKGSSIADALKTLDAAKTQPDKVKAVIAFKKAYTSYVDILNKTANDPKEIKTADKSAYISAIISLKLALTEIEKDAGRIAGDAPNSGDKQATPTKAPVDTKSLSQDGLIKEARAHIALREKVLKDATTLSNNVKTTIQSLNERLSLVLKQVAVAKKAAAESNTMGHDVAVSVIDGYIEESEKTIENAQKGVDAFAKEGGEFMVARGDNGKVFDAVSQPLGAQLKTARDKPWGAVTQMAAANITQVKTLEVILQKMHAAKAEAVSHGSQGKSVKEYLTDILTLKANMVSLLKDMRIKSDRITKTNEEFDAKVKSYGTAKAAILKHCTLVEDQWKRYGPEIITLRDRLTAMKSQVTTLPRGALDDKAVAKASAEAQKTADDSILLLNKQLQDGSALDRKIAITRPLNS